MRRMLPVTGPIEMQRAAIKQATAALERARVGDERFDQMGDVEVGQTPNDVVYRENKLQLRHYPAEREETREIPIVIVYALINRPYILDLQPNRSVVRALTSQGFDVYLIDWGEPSRLDASLTLEDYVVRYIDNCVSAVQEDAGVSRVHLLGYCMGGTMSVMYAALFPERVRTLGLMAAGLCFDDTGGVLERWGDEAHFSPEHVIETYGNVPAEFLDIGFQLMDPVANLVGKYARLYDNLTDEEFVENFARMERWLADGIDVAGETYREFIEEIYQDNALYRNDLTLGDREVRLENITMPVLQIVGEYDHLIPPESSTPLNDVLPSEDVSVIQQATGHIGLSVSSGSHEELWPAVAAWYAEREGPGPASLLERIRGIGPVYADRLVDAGIESPEELASTPVEELARAADVSPGRAANWVDRVEEID